MVCGFKRLRRWRARLLRSQELINAFENYSSADFVVGELSLLWLIGAECRFREVTVGNKEHKVLLRPALIQFLVSVPRPNGRLMFESLNFFLKVHTSSARPFT